MGFLISSVTINIQRIFLENVLEMYNIALPALISNSLLHNFLGKDYFTLVGIYVSDVPSDSLSSGSG